MVHSEEYSEKKEPQKGIDTGIVSAEATKNLTELQGDSSEDSSIDELEMPEVKPND